MPGTSASSLYLQESPSMQNLTEQMSKVDKYIFFKGKYMEGIETLREGKFEIHQ